MSRKYPGCQESREWIGNSHFGNEAIHAGCMNGLECVEGLSCVGGSDQRLEHPGDARMSVPPTTRTLAAFTAA
ncbi:hypothetical protein BN2476_240178 [Paraburkholderia piptadeniae]|uniref:Uncharacterized protein n=1 Tax=Paraburkholderia piptadeniae TaxID=1701573 RepID=A0A1N7RZC7_9BURK|nr:hypothetical protein BN2476_240178 [Paraburkholderia piptadeniae]